MSSAPSRCSYFLVDVDVHIDVDVDVEDDVIVDVEVDVEVDVDVDRRIVCNNQVSVSWLCSP